MIVGQAAVVTIILVRGVTLIKSSATFRMGIKMAAGIVTAQTTMQYRHNVFTTQTAAVHNHKQRIMASNKPMEVAGLHHAEKRAPPRMAIPMVMTTLKPMMPMNWLGKPNKLACQDSITVPHETQTLTSHEVT